jgi:hypothetical protein
VSKIALKSKNRQWPVSSLRPSIAAMHAPLPGWVTSDRVELAAGLAMSASHLKRPSAMKIRFVANTACPAKHANRQQPLTLMSPLAGAEGSSPFFIEDAKCRQADVADFLFTEDVFVALSKRCALSYPLTEDASYPFNLNRQSGRRLFGMSYLAQISRR